MNTHNKRLLIYTAVLLAFDVATVQVFMMTFDTHSAVDMIGAFLIACIANVAYCLAANRVAMRVIPDVVQS